MVEDDLGLKDIYKFNVSFMCKWWRKIEFGTGPWQHCRREKYARDYGIYYSKHMPAESPLWIDMLHVKNIHHCGRRMQLASGPQDSYVMLGVDTVL
jgi:hypothetical protein